MTKKEGAGTDFELFPPGFYCLSVLAGDDLYSRRFDVLIVVHFE